MEEREVQRVLRDSWKFGEALDTAWENVEVRMPYTQVTVSITSHVRNRSF